MTPERHHDIGDIRQRLLDEFERMTREVFIEVIEHPSFDPSKPIAIRAAFTVCAGVERTQSVGACFHPLDNGPRLTAECANVGGIFSCAEMIRHLSVALQRAFSKAGMSGDEAASMLSEILEITP